MLTVLAPNTVLHRIEVNTLETRAVSEQNSITIFDWEDLEKYHTLSII